MEKKKLNNVCIEFENIEREVYFTPWEVYFFLWDVHYDIFRYLCKVYHVQNIANALLCRRAKILIGPT